MSKAYFDKAPWSTQPSLKFKAEEVGVDFDRFITGLKNDFSDGEIAMELGVPEGVITNLREHFFKYGVDSVMGCD